MKNRTFTPGIIDRLEIVLKVFAVAAIAAAVVHYGARILWYMLVTNHDLTVLTQYHGSPVFFIDYAPDDFGDNMACHALTAIALVVIWLIGWCIRAIVGYVLYGTDRDHQIAWPKRMRTLATD